MSIIVAGIHTGIGKTLASAVLVKALECDYWKPVQAGELHDTDSDFIRKFAADDKTVVHKEAYALDLPASPHHAAEMQGVQIELDKIKLPTTENPLVIETAGGLMSPLNRKTFNIDLMARLNLPAVLVTQDYLGSINHTLMSIEMMRQRNIQIIGLVFNGHATASSRELILEWSGLPMIFEMPQLETISRLSVETLAKKNRENIRYAINGK